MSDELNPCPFCGGEAVYTYYNGGWPNHCDNVQCGNWKCPTRSGGRSSRDAAAALWNTRADLTPTDAQIKAHPKVMALVEALTRIEDYALADGTLDFIEGLARAALAALEDKR